MTFSQDTDRSYQHHPTNYGNSLSQQSNGTIDFYDNDVENRSAFSARTPSSRRGTLGSARRKSLMGRNIYSANEGACLEQ
jgi:hypothetical protein